MSNDESFVHRLFASLERGLSWFDSLAKAVGVGIVIAILGLNFDALQAGVRGLAEKLPHLVKVSAFGVNVELDPAAIEADVKGGASATKWLKENWTGAQTRNAVEGLKDIDKRELARLVDIGTPVVGKCRFPTSDVDALYEYAVDRSLATKGLAALTPRSDLLQTKRIEVEKRGAANEAPIECYDIKLEPAGQDVRTAVIRSFASGTKVSSPPNEPAPAPKPSRQ